MAKCINKIINQNIASGGVKNATDNSSGNGDIQLFDSFIDALDGATAKLQRTNCTDVVIDYFSNKFPSATSSVSSAVRGGYDWTAGNINLQQGMQKVGGSLSKASSASGFDSDSIVSSFCVTVTTTFRTIIFYIDTASKVAVELFKKIDRLKAKLETALLDFTSEVRDCIISVIVDAKIAINKTINDINDFDSLVDLMDNCPCISDIVANMFNCSDDSDGNTLTTSSDIVDCVIAKFELDPSTILDVVNDFVDNAILDNVDLGFNMLDKFIKNTMDLLMAPLRELMRVYCVLLNEKINVTSIIKKMGTSKCLMVYTEERDDDGNEYYGMSVLDIINTFKYWANCFEFVCTDFIEDLQTTIKTANEDLRLDDKYWRDIMVIDIYQSCVAVKVQTQQPRPAMIREIFVKNQDKGKNVFVGVIDAFKRVGKIDTTTEPDEITATPIAEAIIFTNGPDQEDLPLHQGETSFKDSSVEDNIINIIRNIGTSIARDNYFERFLQLVEWDSRYKKSSKHTELIEKVDSMNKADISNIIATRDSSTVFDDSSSERVTDTFTDVTSPSIQSYQSPTYEVISDYDEDDIEKIQDSVKPDKLIGETLQSQYTRWYSEVLE